MGYVIKCYGARDGGKAKHDWLVVEKYVKHAYKLNKTLFAFCKTEPNFRIELHYTRKSFEGNNGKTEKWEFAAANKKRISIFAPSVLEKKTTQMLDIYPNTLIHEISHIFYMQCIGTYTPRWLMEGLAANVDGRNYLKEFKWQGKPNRKYLYFSKSAKSNEEVMEFSKSNYLMVKIIIKTIGLSGLMSLLAKYAEDPVKKNYEKLFENFLKS